MRFGNCFSWQAHSPLGEGTGNELYGADDGNFSDLAQRDEPCFPIPRLPLLVRLVCLLFEVLLPVA